MSFLQQLNPRLHLAAAIGWAVFAVVTLAALVSASLAANEAESRARADAESLLAEFATQVRDALSMSFETRRSVLQGTAAQIGADRSRPPSDVAANLEAVQRQFPEVVWLAVTDKSGRVTSSTNQRLQDVDASETQWFSKGQLGPHLSEAGPVSADPVKEGLRTLTPESRVMVLAVPLASPSGSDSGVVVAYLAWSWVEHLLSRMQEALNNRRQVELILVDRQGIVLVGSARWIGKRIKSASDVAEGDEFVIGSRTQLRMADGMGLGWTAIVRHNADLALAPVRNIRRSVFTIVFLAGLLSAAAAAAVAHMFTRRLSQLAVGAESVRLGDHGALMPPPGVDEVSRIGATLAQVVLHLQSEKQALQQLNAELDQRVAERTLRIERMADEARHAAVTRERLRIARDLHDTLAHSLMALLTQIRLIRKLRQQMEDKDLEEELNRAEEVAATGLSGARAAIMQMRGNGVQDTGLGTALRDLTRRFGERTGVAVSMELDSDWTAWADDRAETVYRIAEEALRNVERHAGAAAVRVSLLTKQTPAHGRTGSALPEGGIVEIADDGIGFDAALSRPGHYGLRGMQEQAALIGATLAVDTKPGCGTRIVIEF